MKMRSVSIFLYLFITILTFGASVFAVHAGPFDGTHLDSWVGEFTFGEALEERLFWTHTIVVYKNDGKYYAKINVDGQQTQICLLAKVTGDDNEIQLVFDEHLPDNMFNTYILGQLLLCLIMRDSTLLTEWGELTPIGAKYEKVGEYYSVVHTNLCSHLRTKPCLPR